MSPSTPEIICYEYVDQEGDIIFLTLDEAGLPTTKSKLEKTASNHKPPGENEVIVTRMIYSAPLGMKNEVQSVFQYCMTIDLEKNVSKEFSSYDDEDWYKMFSELERDIPSLNSMENITIH